MSARDDLRAAAIDWCRAYCQPHDERARAKPWTPAKMRNAMYSAKHTAGRATMSADIPGIRVWRLTQAEAAAGGMTHGDRRAQVLVSWDELHRALYPVNQPSLF